MDMLDRLRKIKRQPAVPVLVIGLSSDEITYFVEWLRPKNRETARSLKELENKCESLTKARRVRLCAAKVLKNLKSKGPGVKNWCLSTDLKNAVK